MLMTFKIFANVCQISGASIDNWTAVTKKNFDDFRCSEVCMIATEKHDAFSSPTPASASAPASVPKQKDLLSDFKKGTKRCFSAHGVEESQAVGLMTLLWDTSTNTRCF